MDESITGINHTLLPGNADSIIFPVVLQPCLKTSEALANMHMQHCWVILITLKQLIDCTVYVDVVVIYGEHLNCLKALFERLVWGRL